MAMVIGLTLGLVGGGGSILTVPILVYVIGISPLKAISYSLFIVGTTALVGVFDFYRKKFVDLKAAISFAIPSFTAVFLTRKYILPFIPERILHIGNFILTKETSIMIAFSLLLVFASFPMIRQKQQLQKSNLKADNKKFNYLFIFTEGTIVGGLTGIVGVGGGFLIIPSLVLFAGLPMKMAIGTSLFIIALNSLVGFSTDLISGISIDWKFLLSFSTCAFAGIILGAFLAKKVDGEKLKPAFGWLTIAMAIFIIAKELILYK